MVYYICSCIVEVMFTKAVESYVEREWIPKYSILKEIHSLLSEQQEYHILFCYGKVTVSTFSRISSDTYDRITSGLERVFNELPIESIKIFKESGLTYTWVEPQITWVNENQQLFKSPEELILSSNALSEYF